MQASWCPSVTYAEGFAGAGVYANGHPGSPVIAAEGFLRRSQLLAGKTLTMVLVEDDRRRIERLKQEMAAAVSAHDPVPPGFRVRYEQGECGGKLIPALITAGALQAPVFAFLDSFGGPDVPLALA